MLWVEHDMQLVTDLADRIVVLDQGEVIADGTADVVRRMPNVIAAFLGPEESDTSVHLATS
jgi:branched-chain amino acid transport system ATP-binding protein